MHIYNYDFLKTSISSDVAGLSNVIYDLKGKNELRKSASPKVFDALKKAAIIDSVSGSNAIEGIVTTKKRMAQINDAGFVPATRSEFEILGYKDVLSDIYSGGITSLLSGELVKSMHKKLFGRLPVDAGQFKTEDNWIQERSEDGRISVRFVPVDHKNTPDAVDQWALAYESARQDYGISKLYLICCAVVDFLCIHPFTDGSGRISRLLTTYLLEREGFDIGRYVSLDKKINEYKYNYYDALKQASAGWHENKQDYTPYLIFMMQILYSCYKELDGCFYEESSKKQPKSKQIENLLLSSYAPVSKQEIIDRLPHISATTVELVLSNLIKSGKIEKIGTYRNARYRKK